MKQLFSISLLVCAGAMVTWVTASAIECNALAGAGSSEASYVAPADPVNTWGLPRMAANLGHGRENAPIATAALVR